MLWIKVIAGILITAGILIGLDRLLLKMEARGWIYYRKKHGSSGTLGNALLTIQSIFEPEKKYVQEVRQEEHEEADGEVGKDKAFKRE
jgi:hypothetical protein